MNTFDDYNPLDDIESEEDSKLATPLLLDGVVVTDTDWTTETLLNQVEKGNIILSPRFQRREAWDDKRKSRFIESLMLGLPIPQLVLAEVKGSRGRYLVIDGKQRLLALIKFAASNAVEKLRLRGLDIREDLNGLTWEKIKDNPDFLSDVAAFENAQIRTTVIRGWKDEKALYLIFHRLNSGSVPLSPQELRHVLHPGPFIDFAFEFTESNETLISVLGTNGKPDFRMRDVELLIRFIGFQYFLNEYEGDLKEFLDRTVNELNGAWQTREENIRHTVNNYAEAVAITVDLFGPDAFSKWTHKGSERRFNRAVFDVMTYYFADPELRILVKNPNLLNAVVDAFREICVTNPIFVKTLESTTKTRQAVITRLWLWGKELERVLGQNITAIQNISSAAEKYGIQ